MLRKILAITLILISAILLGLSLASLSLLYTYKQPLIHSVTARIQTFDAQLGQAETALKTAQTELERTLRIVESAEISLLKLKTEFEQAKTLFGNVNGALETQLIPGMQSSRERVDQAKASLIELQQSIKMINDLPFIDLNFPGDEVLTQLISSIGYLDAGIAQMQDITQKASTFIGDASYLMGSDFTETKTGLQNFIVVLKEYHARIGVWRTQLAWLNKSLPGWIESTALGLSIFLLWFSFSQLGLIVHGLSLWQKARLQTAPAQITSDQPTPNQITSDPITPDENNSNEGPSL